MDDLRQSLYQQAQRGVALIVHKLFEEGFLSVSEEQKEEAKTIIGDVLHSSRRKLESDFCKEGRSEADGRGTGQAR